MIKRETRFRVNPRNYPRFSASMPIIIFRVTVLLAAFLLIPIVAQAALLPTPTGSCPSTAPDCVLGKCTVGGAVAPGYELPCNYTLDDILQSGVNFINLILGIVGGLTLLIFVYGGYQMLISMGNPEAIKKGKDTLTGGFIGLILILGVAIFVWFAGALLGAKVTPTGIVSPGVAECGGKADGTTCGAGKTCYNQTCVTFCDYKAATEPACLGFSCQPKIAGLKCAEGFCPGEGSNQCCIAKTQIEALKKQYPEAGTCQGAKEIAEKAEEATTPTSEQGCCAEATGSCKSVKNPDQCKAPGVFFADLCANVPECFSQ